MFSANLPDITMESRVRLRPLSKQCENGVVIIGWHDEFLELPAAGLDFLTWLDEGLTLAQAREQFEIRHDPFPEEDVLEVINAFLACDFVAEIDEQAIPPRAAHNGPQKVWFRQSWARAIFSKPVLIVWLVIAIPATYIWVTTPDLWPKASDYFWTDYYFLVVLVGILLWLLNMVVHESAHWIAARAKGIDASISWSQRVGFIPVSQTVMHNIWAVPRSARLLPIAAGLMWEIFKISLVLYLLYLDAGKVFHLPLLVTKLLKFQLLVATIGLATQFWLFSKRDGYFLLSALLGQRNLQADTFSWLKSRVRRKPNFHPPVAGMKFIYLYVLIIVFWGGLFVGQFLLIDFPIKLQLLWNSFVKISGVVDVTAIDYADGLAVLTRQVILWGLLFYAYWREHVPNWRRAWSNRPRWPILAVKTTIPKERRVLS